jgi:ATP-binding protein involved in chromosome partitioning
MSGFICGHCGKVTNIFSEGGGEKLAREFNVPFLGKLPLDPNIMQSGDQGIPILTNSNNSPAAAAFLELAEKVKNKVTEAETSISANEPDKIEVNREGQILVTWPDGHQGRHTPYLLRINCECAQCKDEDSGRKLIDPKRIPLDIKITGVNPIGRYGLAIAFSDGHNTGIYLFTRLRSICECEICRDSKPDQKSFSI